MRGLKAVAAGTRLAAPCRLCMEIAGSGEVIVSPAESSTLRTPGVSAARVLGRISTCRPSGNIAPVCVSISGMAAGPT